MVRRLTHAPWLSPRSWKSLHSWLKFGSALAGVVAIDRGIAAKAAAPTAEAMILRIVVTFLFVDQGLLAWNRGLLSSVL